MARWWILFLVILAIAYAAFLSFSHSNAGFGTKDLCDLHNYLDVQDSFAHDLDRPIQRLVENTIRFMDLDYSVIVNAPYRRDRLVVYSLDCSKLTTEGSSNQVPPQFRSMLKHITRNAMALRPNVILIDKALIDAILMNSTNIALSTVQGGEGILKAATIAELDAARDEAINMQWQRRLLDFGNYAGFVARDSASNAWERAMESYILNEPSKVVTNLALPALLPIFAHEIAHLTDSSGVVGKSSAFMISELLMSGRKHIVEVEEARADSVALAALRNFLNSAQRSFEEPELFVLGRQVFALCSYLQTEELTRAFSGFRGFSAKEVLFNIESNNCYLDEPYWHLDKIHKIGWDAPLVISMREAESIRRGFLENRHIDVHAHHFARIRDYQEVVCQTVAPRDRDGNIYPSLILDNEISPAVDILLATTEESLCEIADPMQYKSTGRRRDEILRAFDNLEWEDGANCPQGFGCVAHVNEFLTFPVDAYLEVLGNVDDVRRIRLTVDLGREDQAEAVAARAVVAVFIVGIAGSSAEVLNKTERFLREASDCVWTRLQLNGTAGITGRTLRPYWVVLDYGESE